MKFFDIAVIGGGPGGYTAALAAAKNGKSVVLFEENLIGGTCLNAGCIPTKAALNMAKNYAHAKSAREDGYIVSESDFKFDFVSANKKKDESVEKIRNNLTKYLVRSGIEIVNQKARLKAAQKDGQFAEQAENQTSAIQKNIQSSGECSAYNQSNAIQKDTRKYITVESASGEFFGAEYVVVASGGKCAEYPIEGIGLAYSSDKWTKEIRGAGDGDCVVIIGGGVVGLESAAFYGMTGAKVVMIMMEERPLAAYDKDVSLSAQMTLKKNGAVLKTSSVVKSVKKENENLYTVEFESGGERYCISGKFVVDASGRRANLDLGLDEAGVLYDKNGIFTDGNFMTNIENVYAVGDVVNGNIRLAHKAAFDAEQVARHILNEGVNKNPVVPICIYTVPEISAAGMTTEDCLAAGAEFFTGKAMMGANGKAVACGCERGFFKVIFAKIDDEKKALAGVGYTEEKRDKFRLVGAHIIAENSSEIIGGLARLIASGAEKDEILNTPFPHPSISEAFIEAVSNVKIPL
ncbi:MAG: NAD(P)/FAD-dependent oxidoreductase [Clostridiales bacterium]|jgi:dihydrolipoamide dehydrogenase|nr:NAD(P)/FAD-dependent oxidoreductase [Clostridiales bacterium]